MQQYQKGGGRKRSKVNTVDLWYLQVSDSKESTVELRMVRMHSIQCYPVDAGFILKTPPNIH